MYSFDSIIRYSETDQNKTLSLEHLINYFQDCTTFHSESIGQGLETLEKEQKCWMLLGWQIEVNRLPKFMEKVKIATWPTTFIRCKGGRNFAMYDMEGNVLARADSQWVFMDMAKGMPARIPAEMEEVYRSEPAFDLVYDKKKMKIPEDCRIGESFQVRWEHLDTNHHVNNAQYIKMALYQLPKLVEIHQVKAEYKSQAKLGDTIIPKIKEEDRKYLVALCSENDKPFAIIEIQ